MVDRNLINELEVSDELLSQELAAVFGEDVDREKIDQLVGRTVSNFQPGSILNGRIVGIAGGDAIVDVGLKSEGAVPLSEWDEPNDIDIGDVVEVLLETVESDSGLVILSKRKADRILNWRRIVETRREGDEVTGKVMRKIKGGLLVDIGVPVFLPASQVDIRRPGDIGEYIGREIHAQILKIDTDRRNIVISRRKLIEQERRAAKEQLLSSIEVGQIRKGVVKNIADFGAFVDLGGIDGLLHITDMSWDRINHPSELLNIDEEIEVKVLNVDAEREKIALGLKQKTENPWERAEEKYPVGVKVSGEVVNIMNYGAFIKLEPGVEGLVHISEMSWTRRINHPSELLGLGDMVDVVVLDVNKDKQEISLGLKQTEVNPWTRVAERYPPNTIIEGKIRNLANYGAFVAVEEGIDGLLHVSDISWTKKVSHPSEVLKKGQTIRCVVLAVDEQKQRIALGLKQLTEDPWLRAVPEKYLSGQIVRGKITKITNFGVFVELEPDLEGLLHVSELADHKVEDPHKEVKLGDEIEVKILRVDATERKIGLSKKRAEWTAEEERDKADKKVRPRRGGLHGPGEVTTSVIEDIQLQQPKKETDSGDQAPAPEADAAGATSASTEADAPSTTEDSSGDASGQAGPEQAPPAS